MSFLEDVDVRVAYVRAVVARFAPIVVSRVSEEWAVEVAGHPEWLEFQRLIDHATSPVESVGLKEIQRIREALDGLLDLWDEKPMGATYYLYKAAELIELHCRMATGDLRDDAPVPLSEWIDRFAEHMDWQLARSGINLGRPDYFRNLESGFKVDG
jgi:hypothetical protein